MTTQVVLLSSALLLCLGLLLGASWITQAVQPKLRRQTEERRRLNAEWAAVRIARRQGGECPRCASRRLAEQAWDSDVDLSVLSSATRTGPTGADTSGPSSGSLQRNQEGGKSSSEPVPSPAAREQGSGQNSLVQTTLPITIYLSDESAHEQVEAAVEDLLATAGGHIEHRDDPVLGSWFRRMRARTGQIVHSPLAREAAILAAHAAESRLVHAQDATVTATMLQNLGPVLAALQPTKEAVIRAGALLIVKMDSTLVVHQLTSAQQLQLDHQPQLAQSPHDILSALELRPAGSSAQSAAGVDDPCGSMTASRSLNGNPASLRITSNNGEGSTPLNAADHQAFPEA
ncbi:MAG: hypothetical protein ACRDUV_18315 [Pseudonocardiaceae bacterium]